MQMKHVYVFRADGTCVEQGAIAPVPPLQAYQDNHGGDVVLRVYDEDPFPDVPPSALSATIVDGQVATIAVDPAWTPPEPPASLEDHLSEVKDLVRKNLLASEHDRRWLEQKEAAKREGIPWLKAHPSAGQAEFEAAMTAAMATEFPGEPLVVHFSGLIASYAFGAQARGLIAATTFEGLRDLVAATGDKQLQKLLAKL